MPHKLTTGYLITRDICEMDEPKETAITALVDLDDLARRIDEAEAEQLITLQSKSVALIESLCAEIERLKDLCTTMDGQLGKRPCQNNRCFEYNRLAAELAKYRDAPVVAWSHLVKGLTFVETYAGSKPLIVKPGEEK